MLSILRETRTESRALLLLLADPPVIQLRLGPSLRSESIKEGDDVYFECTVRSNPPVRTLQWEHNVSHR